MWWIDFDDAEGKRHRQRAAPTYAVARLVYRDKMNAIAKGAVTGINEEGTLVRTFVEKKYWPTVKPTLSQWEQDRARSILDHQILPTFGGTKLASLRREALERWQAARLADVAGGMANKELMRLKHLLNRAVAWNYLRVSPAQAVKKVKAAPGRMRPLTSEELELLLTAGPRP